MSVFKPTGATVSRRQLLYSGAAMAGVALLPPGALADGSLGRIAGFDPAKVPTAEDLDLWLQHLHELGPVRATGTDSCRAFEEYIASELAGLGLEVRRHPYRLMSWDCDLDRDCSIELEVKGSWESVDVVAYYPYAATTRGTGPVSGEILYAGEGEEAVEKLIAETPGHVLARSVVVVDLPVPAGGSRLMPEFYPETFPDRLPPPPSSPSPSSQVGKRAMDAAEGKCVALVLCYANVSDEAAKYNYLPFGDNHRKTPALWVGAEGGRRLRSAFGGQRIRLRCDATLTPNARADTLVTIIPGQTDEIIFLTTQTDGPNEVNENGALGVLALVKYAVQQPLTERRRTIVAAFPTAHYAYGAVADERTGSGRRGMTRDVMEFYPEIAERAVGHISLEQMGAMDWQDQPCGWGPTGEVAREYWHVTPGPSSEAIRKLFIAATRGENPRWSRSSLLKGNFPPGEGGAPRSVGIPGVGLLAIPAYFFKADPKGVLHMLSPMVMKNQVNIATKLMVMMDRLSREQLAGTAEIIDADLFGAPL